MRAVVRSSSPANVPIDDIDRAIIDCLASDGRMPYTRLGAQVGLSEAAVRQRVQRLVDTAVIRIVAVADAPALGKRRSAMLGVCADGDLVALADRLAHVDGIERVMVTAGRYDLLVEVLVADDEALLDLVNARVRPQGGVRSVEAFVYLRRHGQPPNRTTR